MCPQELEPTLPPGKDLTLTLVNLYDPTVHKMLAPVLLRGLQGHDHDCAELLLLITARGTHPAVADPACGACRASGKPCVVTAKVVDTWAHPVVFAVTRCIECTLTGKVCTLIAQTHLSVCTCEWIMPPSDRPWVRKHVQLSMQSAWQRCKPRAQRMRYPEAALAPHLRKWVGEKIKNAVVQSVTVGDQEYIRDLLGREVYRDDGRWVRPPKQKWTTCVCMPDTCVPLRHVLHDEDDGSTSVVGSECPTLSSRTHTVRSGCDTKVDEVEVDSAHSLHSLVSDEVVWAEGRCCGA